LPSTLIRPEASARGPLTTLSWGVLRSDPASGPRNMAIDEALARELSGSAAVLRLYAWSRATVSFGRNEPTRDRFAGQAAGESAFDFVRRPTGGRAVLHDQELTYAVVAPVRAVGGARELYQAVHRAIASGLRSLGADVTIAEGRSTLPVDAGPCFRAPADGEVVARGRKLVGSAQVRIGRALLQHGSILLSGDQSALSSGVTAREPGRANRAPDSQAMTDPPPTDAGAGPRPTADDDGIALSELLPSVRIEEVASAIREAMAEHFGGRWADTELSSGVRAAAATLERERYENPEWTWRR
jgi:lipoate-protein ligase A